MAPFKSESRNVRKTYDVIPPDHVLTRTARKPFSRPANEIVDAEFEVVTVVAKRPDHQTFNDNRRSGLFRPASEPRAHFGMASAGSTAKAAAGAVSKLPRRGLAGLAAVALVTVALAVHFGPGSFAPLKGGLVISNVRQWPIDSNGLRVIELTGDVENLSRKALPLPALIAEMKSETGAVNQSAISLGDGLLAAGETARFTLRIPSPGGKRQEVSISFVGKGV
jgi:hypothetical protein